MQGSRISSAIAALALLVGSLSVGAGVLDQRAADKKVCVTAAQTNTSVRGLLDDLLTSPFITPAERKAADRAALRRFPKKHC